jgi:hypothetical protein
VLALAASAPAWVRVTVPRTRPLADATVAVAGRSLVPLVPALGLVGLAALVGLVATRGRGRAVLGAVLALAGAAVVAAAVPHLSAPSGPAAEGLLVDRGPLPGRDLVRPPQPRAAPLWPALAAAGGLLLGVAGMGAAVRGGRWPGMSGRYDASAARSRATRPTTPAPAAPTLGLSAEPGDRTPVSPDTPTPPPAPAGTRQDGTRQDGTRQDGTRQTASRPSAAGLWDALDRGDDPTA